MISANALTKRYPEGLEALTNVSFEIDAGEMVFITGHSGAGKSTLFRLLAAIERPTSGSIMVNGQNLAALRRSAIPYLRRNFGLIFQDQKLLFDRSVLANVLLPLAIVGLPTSEALRRARAALDKVAPPPVSRTAIYRYFDADDQLAVFNLPARQINIMRQVRMRLTALQH